MRQGMRKTERVTVTLRKELLERADELVDRVTLRSRSHLVEVALAKLLDEHHLKGEDPLDRWLKATVPGQASDAVAEHNLAE